MILDCGHWHESDIETKEGLEFLESILSVDDLELYRKATQLTRKLLKGTLEPIDELDTRRQLYNALYEIDLELNPNKNCPYMEDKNNPYEH